MIQFNSNIIPQTEGAYLVGGAVRDILLRKIPEDFDFTVKKNPEQFAAAIGKNTGCPVIELGKSDHVLYRIVSPAGIFDVTGMAGSEIKDDLANRDFTINAMALSVATGELTDPFKGLKDLESRQVKMVSERSFLNDPLRMLRAFRLNATLCFNIEEKTEKTISLYINEIRKSAGERIHTEIKKILETENSFRTFSAMAENGLLFSIFPELGPLKECQQNIHHEFDVMTHTLKVLKHLEELLISPPVFKGRFERKECWPAMKYASLFHDTGKPSCRTNINDKVHFYGHEKKSTSIFLSMSDRLKFSNEEKKHSATIIRHHLRPLFLFENFKSNNLSTRAKTTFFLDCGSFTPDVLIHGYADYLSKKESVRDSEKIFLSFLKEMEEDYNKRHLPALNKARLLKGIDLIRDYGLKPSPLFRKILDNVEEARLTGLISSRQEADELVKKILENIDNYSSS